MGGTGGLARFAEEADRLGDAAQELSRAALALTSPRGFRIAPDLTNEALSLCLETLGISSTGLTEDDIMHLRNVLENFSRLPPEDRLLDRLYELVRCEYGPDVPESHIRLIYDKCFRLLRDISNGELSMPQLLIDIARSLFTSGLQHVMLQTEDLTDPDKLNEADTQTDRAEHVSEEVETDRTTSSEQETQTLAGTTVIFNQETQTNAGVHAIFSQETQTAQVDASQVQCGFSNAMLLFERPDVPMSSADIDLSGIQCDITVRHIPFHRFTSFKRVPPMPRNTAIVPNLKIIMAIVRYNAMPSPQLELQKSQLINFLQGYEHDRLILLMTSLTLKMKAAYRMELTNDTTIVKIWGVGPQKITEKDVGTYWKYESGSKQIEPIPTRHFTQTTDCVSLKRAIEPRNW
jgi:hypothetical protein